MLDPIKYSSRIIVNNIPAQWLSKIELYDSELFNFPLMYIHKTIHGRRIYGFPVAIVGVSFCNERFVDLTFEILTNVDLDGDKELKNVISEELQERIGSKDKISKDDVLLMCNGNTEYIDFFTKLWEPVEAVYGEYIPYGKFYEEVYSIVRFVAAFQPRTGRQSEMRMLYNFMSIFGEKIEISLVGKWKFCDFFLIPNYDDLLHRNFENFHKFEKLFATMEKVYNLSFTSTKNIELTNGETICIKCQEQSFPKNKEQFMNTTMVEWINNGSITSDDRFWVDRLIDAFNRFPWRAAFFISSIFMSYIKSYDTWSKDFFTKFYETAGKGVSPKVIACFVQQGFKNPDVIPIDTWIEAFYHEALNIKDKTIFFNSFTHIGKLERVIWLASQANKTNIRQFFNMLWCCRYGINGKNYLRKQNPLSCYECSLNSICKGYHNIKNEKVYITDIATDENHLYETLPNDTLFICKTEHNIPKKVYKRAKNKYQLIDEFSGYLLKENRTSVNNQNVTVEEFLRSITPIYDTEIFNLLDDFEL